MVVLSIETSGCQPQTIVIGRRGTYETTQIAFDLSYLVEAYGSGVAVLAVKRSQDESAYPAVVTQENNTLTWTVSETDTAYVGAGECQLMWYVEGGLAKTIIYPMVVMRDILQTAEEPPDGYENWIEHLTGLGAETQQNAQNAAQSATEAKASEESAAESAQRAEDAAGMLVDVSATATTLEPGQPATAEYDEGVFKFGIPKGDKLTYADLTEADKEDLVQGPILDAQNAAVTAVGNARASAVDAVESAGTTQVNAVNQAGTTQTGAVNQAGANQVAAVNQAGTNQVQAVEDKGAEVLDSIPQDYSDLAAEVDDLNRQISDVEENQIPELKNAINQKAPIIINTASGTIASFTDGADDMPVKKIVAQVEPVQDLHGYDAPWPAGGGKNIVDFGTITPAITNYRFQFPTPIPAGSYVLSFDVADLSWSSSTDTFIAWIGYDSGQYNMFFSDIKRVSDNALLKNLAQPVTGRFYVAVTTNADGKHCNIAFRSDSYKLFTSGTMSNIMLEAGTAPTDFAPYSNICPISGWTGAEVTRTGKNILAKPFVYAPSRASFSDCFFVKVGTYRLSFSAIGSATKWRFRIALFDAAGNVLSNSAHSPNGNMYFNSVSNSYIWGADDTAQNISIRIAEDCYMRVWFIGGDTTQDMVAVDAQLELDSASPYEPYTGNQISVNWETEAGTVYGGEDEVISGKLKSTMGMVDLGTLNWTLMPNDKHLFYAAISGIKPNEIPNVAANIKSDRYKTVSASAAFGATQDCVIGQGITGIIGNVYIMVVNRAYSDAASFKTAMSGAQLVYEIAEPVEYDLTPQTMETLYGTNNIWSSTGDTEVEYPCDTKLYIDGKLAELQATILENIGG